MNDDAPIRGLFKFWAHMFDYRDEHKYGSHSLRRRSGTDHPNLVYWYSIALGPSLKHPNPRLTLRRH
ncbi:BnaC07g13100D, partial [Brassica napus]